MNFRIHRHCGCVFRKRSRVRCFYIASIRLDLTQCHVESSRLQSRWGSVDCRSSFTRAARQLTVHQISTFCDINSWATQNGINWQSDMTSFHLFTAQVFGHWYFTGTMYTKIERSLGKSFTIYMAFRACLYESGDLDLLPFDLKSMLSVPLPYTLWVFRPNSNISMACLS